MGGAAAKASGRAVVAKMKALPTDDDAFGPGGCARTAAANSRRICSR